MTNEPVQDAVLRLECLRLAASLPFRSTDDVVADADEFASFVIDGPVRSDVPRYVTVLRDVEQGEVLKPVDFALCGPGYARWANATASPAQRRTAAAFAWRRHRSDASIAEDRAAPDRVGETGEGGGVEMPSAPARSGGVGIRGEVADAHGDAVAARVPGVGDFEARNGDRVHGSGSSGCGDREDDRKGGRGATPSAVA